MLSDGVRPAHPVEKRRQIAAILGALEHGALDDETRQLFLEMLLSMLAEVNTSLARIVSGAVIGARGRDFGAPTARHPWMKSIYEGESLDSNVKYEVDLFVLAIKRVELNAILDVFFSRGPGERYVDREAIENGKELWVAKVGSKTVGIGWAVDDGQPEAAIAMSIYSRFVSFDCACIIGTAGGKRGSVWQGDVVVATDIVDYDRRRVVPGPAGVTGELSTPPVDRAEWRLVETDHDWRAQVSRLQDGEGDSDWRQRVRSLIPDCTLGPLLMEPIADGVRGLPDSWRGRIIVKPILSGGALVEAEEELERLLTHYHPEAVALDMESYGFAKWCKVHRLRRWLVVRCISDYCGPDSRGESRPKSWQYPATYVGGRVLRDFLLRIVFDFPEESSEQF